MFTGIIQTTGRILSLDRVSPGARVRIACPTLDMSGVAQGDSISVSGVCLTVTAVQDGSLDMDLSNETLERSTFGHLQRGDEVNLETALTLASRLGGHLVSGHVDDVGEVTACERAGESVRLKIAPPPKLAKYIAEKGSICVDGVSLTVNSVDGAEFAVNVIPHTLRVTTLKHCRLGTRVNLEVDLVARYVERLLLGGRAADADGLGITGELLARYGSHRAVWFP